MSYVGYVIEELMHGKQREIERRASGYGQRHAARAERRSSRRVRTAARAREVRPTTAVSGAPAVDANC